MDALRPLGSPTAHAQAARPPAPPPAAPDPVDTAVVGAKPLTVLAVDAVLGLSAAVRSGAAGAGGPVLDRELKALNLPLLKSKLFRLPFTDRHTAVSVEDAVGFLARGKGDRVHVDVGSGPRPLTGPEDLAALQHLRDLPTERPAPLEAALLKPFAVGDPSAQALDPYEGYLKLKAHEPIVLLHQGLPVLKAADVQVLQDALPEAAQAADRARGGDLVPLFRHVVSVVGEDSEALQRVLPGIQVPHADGPAFLASCLAMLKAGISPEQAAARQEIAQGSGYPARLAFLKPFGLEDPGTPPEAVQAAEAAVQALVAAGLPEETARAAAEALRSALARKRRDDLPAMLQKLSAAGTPGLLHMQEFGDLIDSDAGRSAFDRAVRQGRGVVRAFAEVGGLSEALHHTGQTWDSYSDPVYQAYETMLGSGDAGPGAAFLRELVLNRKAGEDAAKAVALVRKPLTGLSFEQRIGEFRSLGLLESDSRVLVPSWEAFAADVGSGVSPGDARARLARLDAAFEEKKVTYNGYMAPVYQVYAAHGAGRADAEDALGFLVDMVGKGIHGEEAADLLKALSAPAGKLTLAQRVKLFGELGLPGQESSVRLAAWAAVRADLDGGATPPDTSLRVQLLAQACVEGKLTYYGYIAPLYQAWAETLAGKPESGAAVDFLVSLVKSGIHGSEGEQLLRELAQPAGRLSFAQRVQEFSALAMVGRESQTRVPVWQAFRRDLDGGAVPADARARVERLDAAFAPTRTYYGYRNPVFEAWKDGGAGTADSDAAVTFLAELVAKDIQGDEAAKVMAEVAQPAGSLTLAERGRWFHDLGLSSDATLNQGSVRPAVWSAFRKELAAGTAPDAAHARLERLTAALKAKEITYSGYIEPVFTAWSDLAAGTAESDAAAGFLVDVIGKGVHGREAADALKLVLPPAGALTLAERVQAFHDLDLPAAESEVRKAIFEAFRADVAGGTDTATARARLGRLAQAYAQAEVTYSSYLAKGYEAYGKHFAGTAEAEAGLGLMTLLASKGVQGSDAEAVAAEVAQPAGPLTLAERVQAFQDLKLLSQERLSHSRLRLAVYGSFRGDVAGGAAKAVAQGRIERLSQALEGQTYEGYMTPVFTAWAGSFAGTSDSDAGVQVLADLTKAGVTGDETVALAQSLAAPFGGLSLSERFGFLKRLALEGPQPLRESGVRGAVYDTFRREAAAGLSLADSEARVRSLTDALAAAGVTWRSTLQGFLESYASTLAGEPLVGPRWPVRLLQKGVPEGEIRQSMELFGKDIRPLLERADTEVAAAVTTLLSRPPNMPWGDELRALKSTLEILLGARRGPEESGSIAEEGGEIVIGDIRLPRK